jgi:F-type H+-transporting ATPase subunit alpha
MDKSFWKCGSLKLELAQYREVVVFAQFGSNFDDATQYLLNHGVKLTKVFKQPQYSPIPIEKKIVVIYATIKGYLYQIPISNIDQYEHELLKSIVYFLLLYKKKTSLSILTIN